MQLNAPELRIWYISIYVNTDNVLCFFLLYVPCNLYTLTPRSQTLNAQEEEKTGTQKHDSTNSTTSGF